MVILTVAMLPMAVLAALLSLSNYRQLHSLAPEITRVALVDGAGRVIVDGAPGAERPPWLPPPRILEANFAAAPTAVRAGHGWRLPAPLAVAPVLRNNAYAVFGGVAEYPATPSTWRLATAMAFPIVTWLVVLAVAWFGIDRLVMRPILQLRRAGAAFAEGHRDARADGLGEAPTEIRQLGRTMNVMADRLADREDDLQRALEEQKNLLRELHHRVKNNLQVITSLVNLQIRGAKTSDEERALRAVQDRIYALAAVHDNLHKGGSHGRLRLDRLLPEIIDHLRRGRLPQSGPINVTCELDPIETTTERAVALALLLCEAVSDALGRGPARADAGSITVRLSRTTNGAVDFTVACDDPSAGLCAPEPDSLERQLVAAFARQLRGQMSLETTAGYRLRVTIPDLG